MRQFLPSPQGRRVSLTLFDELVFFGGYTNGLIGYLAPAHEIPRGGYEFDWMPIIYGLEMGYVMHARPETADRIAETVRRLYEQTIKA